jgi:murein DD-endopeptidase MepM/ murein hydrolase activator NlpD
VSADSRTTVTSAPPLGGIAAVAPTRPATGEQARQLAQEFEALFVYQMLKQMRSAMLADEDENQDGLGAGTMTDSMDQEYARAVAKSGGLGLAAILQKAIERQAAGAGGGTANQGNASIEGPAGPESTVVLSVAGRNPAGIVAAPTLGASESEGEVAVPIPLGAKTSSAYGWRSDPFDGKPRFHGGIDLAAAYGREVPAAAGGRVVVAREEAGYGLTVVVDHGNGVTTRYGHLSAAEVAAGDEVAAGQNIGRVGSSGRSTGPHLHFEVRQNDRVVDPQAAAARYAVALKKIQAGADLAGSPPTGQESSVGVVHEN